MLVLIDCMVATGAFGGRMREPAGLFVAGAETCEILLNGADQPISVQQAPEA
jgi:hypothetical protein